tara:strand:+ start:703 stop:960 length:258 start_codon:yes stop_codon:yes gene_type:complete
MQTAEQRIAELEAQVTELKSNKEDLTIKFGNKQNICVYNLGQRFPVTLYAPGWLKLIENIDQVRDFIEENHTELSWGKGEDPYAQ